MLQVQSLLHSLKAAPLCSQHGQHTAEGPMNWQINNNNKVESICNNSPPKMALRTDSRILSISTSVLKRPKFLALKLVRISLKNDVHYPTHSKKKA